LPFIFAKSNEGMFLVENIKFILAYNKIIAWGFEDVIDLIRLENPDVIPFVIDIITMKELCIGKPKKEFKNEMPWSLIQLVGKYIKKSTLLWVKKIVNLEIIDIKETKDHLDNINDLMNGFISCFLDIENELKDSEEYERFYNVEVKMYNIFINTQKIGIKISQRLLYERLKELKNEYYTSIKELEFNYDYNANYISYNMTWDDISDYCDLIDFKSEFEYDFWETVEILQEKNDFLNHLLIAYESLKDYHELLKYKVDRYNCVYPTFDIVGTVTSRILIKTPGIQYIKKRNRISSSL
jgi:hypothetical protein